METQLSRGELSLLWATNGSDGALACAEVIRNFCLPRAKSLRCLAVAPVEQSMRRRLTHLSEAKRWEDMQEAAGAAERSVAALGDISIPIESASRWGNPATEIANEVRETRPDLVVLGASSNSRPANLGGTTRALAKSLEAPLLIGRPVTEPLGPVVVLFQTREAFVRSISLLLSLNVSREAPIYLVTILDPVRPGSGILLTRNMEELRRNESSQKLLSAMADDAIKSARPRLEESGYNVIEEVKQGDLAGELASLVDHLDASLVITTGGGPEHPEAALEAASHVHCSVLVTR